MQDDGSVGTDDCHAVTTAQRFCPTPLLLVGSTNPVPPLLAEIPARSLKFSSVVRIGVEIACCADAGAEVKQSTTGVAQSKALLIGTAPGTTASPRCGTALSSLRCRLGYRRSRRT